MLYHFEDVDMKEAKRILGGTACISGNLPSVLLEFGEKEKVADYCKYHKHGVQVFAVHVFRHAIGVEDYSRPGAGIDVVLETYK